MNLTDLRGAVVTGATRPALAAYERALASWQSWRNDDAGALAAALHDSPGFVAAHLLRAWQLVSGRDRHRIELARPLVAKALSLPAKAKALLGRALRRDPRDVVALQVAHSLDYVTGDVAGMRRRTGKALRAWSRDDPGFHAVLAMHAFALCEAGDYAQAEDAALAALELDPLDARACHAMAHVFEMTDRAEAGARWLIGHADAWARASTIVTHGWWHVALFHLTAHEPERALSIYDAHVRRERSREVSDLIDASALLWRIALSGTHAGNPS